MSDEVPAKKSSAVETDSDSVSDDEEKQYSKTQTVRKCDYIWCIKCEKLLDWVWDFNEDDETKIWDKKTWKCLRCKPKKKSIFIYRAHSEHQSYMIMKEELKKEPYEEPYWLCVECLFLHDDNYDGKCESFNECRGVGDVSVYYGYDYEYAKRLARKKRRDAEDNTDESPTKKPKVFIDLTD